MMFDTTGLTEIKMKKHKGKQGSYYVNGDECVAKTCSGCLNVLPSDSFGLCSSKKYKLTSRCYECRKSYASEYFRKPYRGSSISTSTGLSKQYYSEYMKRTDEQVLKDRERKRPSGKKKCQSCKKEQPLSNYSSHRGKGDGLSQVCKVCQTEKDTRRRTMEFFEHWSSIGVPIRCYLCGGPYEEVEHLIPISLGGDPGPTNTRPSCISCNRGIDGKHGTPLEVFILQVNHPMKTRAQILYEIVMSGAWPFSLTSPEEFSEECDNYIDITIDP